MIRRGFWLSAGAVAGIYGYRRVSAIGRRLSASLNPAGSAQEARLAPEARLAQRARLARRGRRGAIGVARETYRFSRDVREGMELYMARHSAPAGSTLGARDREPAHAPEQAAVHEPARAPERAHALDQARGLGPARDLRTNHDPRPKDGH